MAVKQNDSEEAVAGGIALFTGPVNVQVVAVNPTLAQLNKMELMFQQEPKYTVNFGGDDLQKIVFWARNAEGNYFPIEFLIAPGPWESKKSPGKLKWLNKIGQESWSPKNSDGTQDASALPDWYDAKQGGYICPRGYDGLIEFIKSWANVANKDEVFLETCDAICKGDVEELKELIKALKSNRTRILTYVRDGKYQAVYTRHFGRVKPQNDHHFVTAINKPYGEIKGEWTMEFTEYTPGLIAPDPTGPVADGAAPAVMEPEDDGLGSNLDDDLPF
jgi:hypothetical protein